MDGLSRKVADSSNEGFDDKGDLGGRILGLKSGEHPNSGDRTSHGGCRWVIARSQAVELVFAVSSWAERRRKGGRSAVEGSREDTRDVARKLCGQHIPSLSVVAFTGVREILRLRCARLSACAPLRMTRLEGIRRFSTACQTGMWRFMSNAKLLASGKGFRHLSGA